jgi:class 3 adenylate cyclase/CHASE1-domain containing sensor protein
VNSGSFGFYLTSFGETVKKIIDLVSQSFRISQKLSYFAILISVCIAVPACFLIFNTIRLNEKEKFRDFFNDASSERIAAVAGAMQLYENSLHDMAALFQSTDYVSRDTFDIFATSLISRYPAIQALEWVPLVKAEDKERYEEEGKKFRPDFQIFELDENKEKVPVKPRSEYFPVFYVIPYADNRQALGFDLGSNPVRKETIDQARLSGVYTATARLKLVQEKTGQFSVLMLLPIYENSKTAHTETDKWNNLKGLVLGAFRIADVLSESLNNMSASNIGVIVKDLSASPEEQFLYYYSPSGAATPPEQYALNFSKTIKIDGRIWSIICISEPGYSVEGQQWIAWSILLNSLLIVFLIAGYLISLVARNEKIKAIVDERTLELRTETERVNLLNEQLSKKALTFRKFVPNQFLDMLNLTSEESIDIGKGSTTYLTICFIDMRGFTAISEAYDPDEILHLINDFFSQIIPVISEREGFIDKFTGDGMLIIFPKSSPALHACVEIGHKISQTRFQLGNAPLAIDIGIALHTGSIIAGTVGTNKRMQTTVIGDTVNTCSRVEQLNKVFGTKFLVTEEVYRALENRHEYMFRLLGNIEIRGKKETKKLYEVLDVLPAEERTQVCSILPEFDKALICYEAGQFKEAQAHFQICLDKCPFDGPSAYFLNKLTMANNH